MDAFEALTLLNPAISVVAQRGHRRDRLAHAAIAHCRCRPAERHIRLPAEPGVRASTLPLAANSAQMRP
jgi:hypothetical protein